MKRCSLGVVAIAIAAATCFADTPQPSKFYKLEFVIKEVDGSKVLNSRAYTTMAAAGGDCTIRTGSSVPVPVSPGSSQYRQIDVGVSIDCGKITETEDGLLLSVSAEVSSLASPPSTEPPIVRQNRWRATLMLPLRKPTVIFSSDDLTSKHQMQVELTATAIK